MPLLLPKLELAGIVGAQVRLARTPKRTKKGIVGSVTKQALMWGFIMDDFGWESVNEENSDGKSCIPKFQWYGGMS